MITVILLTVIVCICAYRGVQNGRIRNTRCLAGNLFDLTKIKLGQKNGSGLGDSATKLKTDEKLKKDEDTEKAAEKGVKRGNVFSNFEPPKGIPGGSRRRQKKEKENAEKSGDPKECISAPEVEDTGVEEQELEPIPFYKQPKKIETRAMRKQREEDEMRANGTFTSYLSRIQDDEEIKPWSLADTIGVNSTTLRALFDLQTEITNFFTKISNGLESVAVLVSTKVERDLRTVGLSSSYVSRRTTKEIRKLTGGKTDDDRSGSNPFALPSSVQGAVTDGKARSEAKALFAKGINPLDIVNRGKEKSQLLGGVATGGSTKERVAIRKKRRGGVFANAPTAASSIDSDAKSDKKVNLRPDSLYRSVRVLPDKLKYDYQRRERKQQASGTRDQRVQTVTRLLQDGSDILVTREDRQLGDGERLTAEDAVVEETAAAGGDLDAIDVVDVIVAEDTTAVDLGDAEEKKEEEEDEMGTAADPGTMRFLRSSAVKTLVETLASTSADEEEEEVLSLARVSPELSNLQTELVLAMEGGTEWDQKVETLARAREASERVLSAAIQAVRLEAEVEGEGPPVTFREESLLVMRPTDARAAMDGLWIVAEAVREASASSHDSLSVYAGVLERCGRDEGQRKSLLSSFQYLERVSKVASQQTLVDLWEQRTQELFELVPAPEPMAEPAPEAEVEADPAAEIEEAATAEPGIDLSSFTFQSAFEEDEEDEERGAVTMEIPLVDRIVSNEGGTQEVVDIGAVFDKGGEGESTSMTEKAEEAPLVIDTEAETTATTEERVASALVQSIDIGFFLLETLGRAIGPVLSDGGRVLSLRYKQVLQPDQRLPIRSVVRTGPLRAGSRKDAASPPSRSPSSESLEDSEEAERGYEEKEKEEEGETKAGTDSNSAAKGRWRLATGLQNAKAIR